MWLLPDSRHPLHMINQSTHRWLFCMINIIFLLSWWSCTIWGKKEFRALMMDKCLHACCHHGVTTVQFGKGVKTVECNYRCLKSARELAIKHMLKISTVLPLSISMTSAPKSYLKSLFEISWVKFLRSRTTQWLHRGRQRALMSTLPVGLHRTMDLSDQICWSEHPSAVFLNK